jgi:hypothetical protein
LTDAGGKYLERREIINIFSQHLKKAYPGLEVSTVKKTRERYEGVKTCNFKGCNLSFRTGKELTAHRKVAHEERRHDHSGRLYTCPAKNCHRRKRSKGFPSIEALKEHQIRMQHWGPGTYHGDPTGPQLVEGAAEGDTVAGQMQAGDGAQALGITMQQPLPPFTTGPPELPLFPSMPGDAGHEHMPIDPGLQHGLGSESNDRQDMVNRLQALEMERQRMEMEQQRMNREMERIRQELNFA